MSYVVAALYKFVSLPGFKEIQKPLKDLCDAQKITGTLLLAHEGINGTVAGSREAIDALCTYLASYPEFDNLEYKESHASENPFLRMKVRLKKEIVTIGIPEVSPTNAVGTYLDPKEWNDVISDPDVVVLDTRNDYEVEIGTFKNAINPKTDTFREFPKYVRANLDPKKHKKVAMFCTGGIRCEKASSFMLAEGFDTVYHLKGGILKYLETVPEEKSLWDGECFVFDGRIGVKHGLEEGQYDQCHACRYPITEDDKNSEHYIKGIQCHRCVDKSTESQKKRFRERQKQIELAKQRGESHIGANAASH
jgi:UPF0176 protein